MRVFNRENRFLALALTGLAVLAFAAPSLAGTVYKWTTEGGTTAFTDDPKRIPARYQDAAERRQMGKLSNYSRYTVAKSATSKPYNERVESRLEALRKAPVTTDAPRFASAPHAGGGTALELGLYENNDQLHVPASGNGSEPLTIESYRVKLRNHITTQEVRVIRRGDELVAVQVDRREPGKISSRRDVLGDDVLRSLNRDQGLRR